MGEWGNGYHASCTSSRYSSTGPCLVGLDLRRMVQPPAGMSLEAISVVERGNNKRCWKFAAASKLEVIPVERKGIMSLHW